MERIVAEFQADMLLQTAIVSDSRSAPGQRRRRDELVKRVGMQVVPFDAEQLSIARAAYLDFGLGSGIRLDSMSAIASPMRSLLSAGSRCFSKAMTSRRPAYGRLGVGDPAH